MMLPGENLESVRGLAQELTVARHPAMFGNAFHLI